VPNPVVRTRRGSIPFAQHLHFIGNNFSRVFVLPILALPFARAKPALDEDLGTLGQIHAGNLGQLAKENDPVPFGLLALLVADFVFPMLRRRDADIGDLTAA
jgi:hypothetical protein